MRLLNPAWLLLSLLALPILLMYMLKLRRKEVEVSSTMLWQALLRDRQANTPWQRLKRNLLLLLQLLILAGLVFSLARPAINVPSLASGSVIVLLDASASMSATDVLPSRFEAARGKVRTLIQEMTGDAAMTLIQVGDQPVVLATQQRDQQTLLQALQAAQPSQGTADWKTAFALAVGAAKANAAGSTASILIVSDGGLPKPEPGGPSSGGLPALPGQVRYVPVGTSDDNLAISALALRQADNQAELFASVANYSREDRQVVFSLYANNNLIHSEALLVPKIGQVSLTISDLPAAGALYAARLSSPSSDQPLDALALDNVAFAVQRPSVAGRALLISAGVTTPAAPATSIGRNFFLEQVLAAMPGISTFRALPSAVTGIIQIPEDPFDLYILDGVLPGSSELGAPVLPDGNLLIVNPPVNSLFTVSGVFTPTQQVRVAEHALTQFVDWSSVHVARARYVDPPPWAEILVRTEEGPLVFAGQSGGRRVAVLTFDLHDSDLPLQITFPILFSNLINYLVPAQAFDAGQGSTGYRLQPGDDLAIRIPPYARQVVIAAPNDQAFIYQPTGSDLIFSETSQLGLYAVNFLAEVEGDNRDTAQYFAVNLFDARESNIRPAESLAVGQGNTPASLDGAMGQRDIWRWPTALALAILILEWMLYHRRLSSSPLLPPALPPALSWLRHVHIRNTKPR